MSKTNEPHFPAGMLCCLLSVSRSGYYACKHRPPSARERSNQALEIAIKRVFDDEKGRPGAPNLLEQDFSAAKPDQKWVSDSTYSWTDEGWLYLAVVLELYARRVIGWASDGRMTATPVCDALAMALWKRRMATGVIVHSDWGSQYCSAVYQKLFSKHRLVCSMSKKGDCYGNAAMASWNHSFKVAAVNGERFKTRSDAKHQVFKYIEVHYNRKRLHSKLGYLSPIAFETKKVA